MKKLILFLFLTSLFYFASCPKIFDSSKYNKDEKKEQTSVSKTSDPTTQSTSLKRDKKSSNSQQNYEIPTSNIEKGEVPKVNFSATDPCQETDSNGLPWESPQTDKITLPEGVEATMPPELLDVKSLSEFSYNAAVSTAFEGMRLVYGPMSNNDANRFSAAWAPIFSYPNQQIIDYLNKLNPLISQFLATRESFMRTVNDVQLCFLDVTVADELEEEEAMDAIIAEAGLYFVQLTKFDAALKDIAKRMEILGNPPNPMEAQCEARKRYDKFFEKSQENDCSSPLTGIWTGYTEGGSDSKYYSKLPIMVVFYDMPMEDPNTGKSKCTVEGIMFGGNKSSIGTYNPVLPFSWTSKMIKKVGRKKKHVEFTVKNVYKQLNDYMSKINPKAKIPLPPNNSDRHIVLDKVVLDQLPPVYKGLGNAYLNKLKEELKVLRKKAITDEDKYVPLLLNCNNAIDIIDNQLRNRTHFFSTAKDWLEDLPLDIDNSEQNGIYKRLGLFTDRMEPSIERKKTDTPPSEDSMANDKLSPEEQAHQDAIAQHKELIKISQANIEYANKRKADISKEMWNSANKNRREDYIKQLKELDLRIIGYQSNIQAEKDLIKSRLTGNYVHTRTVFDEYARVSFIQNIRKNAKRMDDTRRIAGRIERQIKLLPKENQDKARQIVKNNLTSKVIGTGDIEVANNLRNALNKQIMGFAKYDGAIAEIDIINSQENEYYAKTGIAMVGVGVVGAIGIYGPLATTYGATSAQAIYGPYLLSSIYGGTTGLVSGGPKEGLVQAINWAHPFGVVATQFAEGYQDMGQQENATTTDQITEGTKRAAVAWAFGVLIKTGISGVTKVSTIARNGTVRLSKSISNQGQKTLTKLSKLFKSRSTTGKVKLPQSSTTKIGKIDDNLFHSHRFARANENINTFKRLELNIARKIKAGASRAEIAKMEQELQQYTAELNADYHAKWILKYKSHPILRRKFDFRVQNNYRRMTPEMIASLKKQGYNMDGIEFRQFRNASSGSSSSMDLDMAPVLKSTGKEPNFFMKNGKRVSVKEFMNDAQNSMNTEYYKIHNINAKVSEMNLVTSEHPEAFATTKLLDHNVDFSKITPKELASVGKVLKVKMDGISANRQLSQITKLQAKSREATKEIENMLLKKLRQDLAKSSGKAAKLIEKDIQFWESMHLKFKTVGMQETNPMEIMKINNEVRMKTGGKEMSDVMNDLVGRFGG